MIAISPTTAFASGWNDYRLEIDLAYEIVRANSLDVGLCRIGGPVVLLPRSYPGLGPICEYSVTPTFIFTRHYGRTPRNLFAGDDLEEVDTSKTFFCITRKTNGQVSGPFDQKGFDAESVVRNAGSLTWTAPRNPNVIVPVIGTIFFLVASAMILGWPIAILVGLIVVIWLIRRRRVRLRAVENFL